MKIGAVIAEFNPLHAGHKHLIDTMKSQCDATIAVMSGNFVQRGECAVFEKHFRAYTAIKNGIDLVLELPAVFALSSAEGFARGAIGIIDACSVADSLWFGSEAGDIDCLTQYAQILNNESSAFKKVLSSALSKGLSFPAARQAALEEQLGRKSFLDMPNNILAVEYIRELLRLNSNIKPVTIKRIGAGYNDTDTKAYLPSASAIRALLKEGAVCKNILPFNAMDKPLFMDSFDIIIASRLKVIPHKDLCLIPDCNSEIASRLKENSLYNTFEEIVQNTACKRYPQSRIRRILCSMITENRFITLPEPSYIRPLVFNQKGSELIKKIKSTASLPLAARGAILKNDPIFQLECRCSDIYNLPRKKPGGAEYNTPAKIIR